MGLTDHMGPGGEVKAKRVFCKRGDWAYRHRLEEYGSIWSWMACGEPQQFTSREHLPGWI